MYNFNHYISTPQKVAKIEKEEEEPPLPEYTTPPPPNLTLVQATLKAARQLEPRVPLAQRRQQLEQELNQLLHRAVQLPSAKALDEKLEDINLYVCDAINEYNAKN